MFQIQTFGLILNDNRFFYMMFIRLDNEMVELSAKNHAHIGLIYLIVFQSDAHPQPLAKLSY